MHSEASDSPVWEEPASLRRAALAQCALKREWMARSDRYGWYVTLRILGPFFATLALAPYFWTAFGALTALPVVLILGTYGYKISFIMHDCSHDSLFRTRGLNDRVGIACGWLVGADYFQFKRVHREHHQFNLTQRDPQFEEAGGMQGASRRYLSWHLSKALVGGRIFGYLSGYHGSAATPSTARTEKPAWGRIALVAGIQIVIALVATGFGEVPVLALAYPAGAVTIALFLARFRTFAEHVEPAGRNLPDFVRTHRPNWFDALFFYDAHFNYHLEHHLFPSIASCHLAQVHRTYGTRIHGDLSLGGSMISTVVNRLRQAQS